MNFMSGFDREHPPLWSAHSHPNPYSRDWMYPNSPYLTKQNVYDIYVTSNVI